MSKNNIGKYDVITYILDEYGAGNALNFSSIKKTAPLMLRAAQKWFGSWKNGIEEAGLNYEKIKFPNRNKEQWTKEEILNKIKSLELQELSNKVLKERYIDLYKACIKLFGSRKKAIEAAGLDYESTLSQIPWTKDRIISTIQLYHLKGIPLNFKFIKNHHNLLLKRAEKTFGSWGVAIETSGLNYEEIKKNKSSSKPFLGQDGIIYPSKEKGLIANELLRLKKNNEIFNYEHDQIISNKKFTCDFVIDLLNGAKLWVETNNSSKEKIDFYDKANLFYITISSFEELASMIKNINLFYNIPKRNSIITTHINPDGDALASCKAIQTYLQFFEKESAIKLVGNIPKNLEWIIEDCNIDINSGNWEQVIVLDSGPDRTGWDLPETLPIFNIDHHIQRVEDNNPEKGIHVIPACSTAQLLITRFGIIDEILSVGIYTDTLFTRRISEVFYCLDLLDINEDKLNKYISRVNSNPDKTAWKIIRESKVHHCKNGFIIMETLETDPATIEMVMQVLNKISNHVCLVYGPNKMVKLRTDNHDLDLRELAERYGGGGHSFAAGIPSVEGKSTQFKTDIVALKTPTIDGYVESRKNETPQKID